MITSMSLIAGTFVSSRALHSSGTLVDILLAMTLIDNTVALRQLELANSALLSQTNTQAWKGQSLAKDGKFHPRVLTLVRLLSP